MSERKGWMLLEGGPWGEMRKPEKKEEKTVEIKVKKSYLHSWKKWWKRITTPH